MPERDILLYCIFYFTHWFNLDLKAQTSSRDDDCLAGRGTFGG